MTKNEEDALINATLIALNLSDEHAESIRIAIRAAVAFERERAAKCCVEKMVDDPYGEYDDYNIACSDCAAAIAEGNP